jgi:hypothetical protein
MTYVARFSALAAALFMSSAAGLAQATVDLTGKWTFTVETSAGSGTPNITLRKDVKFRLLWISGRESRSTPWT